MINYKEIKDISLKELKEMLIAKRSELHGFRFKAGENQLKTVREIRRARKEIALILTAINAKSQIKA